MKILVTGAAKRIGAAVVKYLAQKGHQCVIHCNRSLEEARELRESLPNPKQHDIVKADLTDPEQRQSLFEKPFDVLVNNASQYIKVALEDAQNDTLLNVYDVNFFMHFEMMRLFHQLCKKGQIINILDHRIDHPDPRSGPYAFAKKSLRDATLACAIQWAPDIRTNAIAPGFVLPPDGVPLEKMDRLVQGTPGKVAPTPEDIARTVEFLMTTPAINGQVIYLDAGMHLIAPCSATQLEKI